MRESWGRVDEEREVDSVSKKRRKTERQADREEEEADKKEEENEENEERGGTYLWENCARRQSSVVLVHIMLLRLRLFVVYTGAASHHAGIHSAVGGVQPLVRRRAPGVGPAAKLEGEAGVVDGQLALHGPVVVEE